MAAQCLRVKSVTPSQTVRHHLNIVLTTGDGESTVQYLKRVDPADVLMTDTPFEHMRALALDTVVGEIDDDTGVITILPEHREAFNEVNLTHSKVGNFTFARNGGWPGPILTDSTRSSKKGKSKYTRIKKRK